jgi:hypothetical protein
MTNVERSRGDGGGDRRRDRSRPSAEPGGALPQPRAIAREVREIRVRVEVFAAIYGVEHEALLALGSSEVHVTSSPGSLTEATVIDAENEAARRRCARAVAHLRSASTHIEMALKAFGPLVEQPRDRSPDAVVDQSTFDRAVNRRRHREREEELRRG